MSGPKDPSRYDPSAYDDAGSGEDDDASSSGSGSDSDSEIDMEYIRSLAAASQEKAELEQKNRLIEIEKLNE